MQIYIHSTVRGRGVTLSECSTKTLHNHLALSTEVIRLHIATKKQTVTERITVQHRNREFRVLSAFKTANMSAGVILQVTES